MKLATDGWELFPIILVVGIVLSLPSLGIYALFFNFAKTKIPHSNAMRLTLLFISFILIAVSFLLLGGGLVLWFIGAYLLASTFSMLIFWRRLSPS
jgi:hypothetical protein